MLLPFVCSAAAAAAIALARLSIVIRPFSKLRVGRSTSLQKYGEYGFENLVFKELRNAGYIDKVRSTVVNFKTKSLSL